MKIIKLSWNLDYQNKTSNKKKQHCKINMTKSLIKKLGGSLKY